MPLRSALLASILFLAGCTSPDTTAAAEFRPAKRVTPSQALAIAAAYRTHQWTAEERHAFHGLDPEGIRIDTPDHAFRPTDGTRPGWWIPGQANTGVPYKWGGFDTPAQFDAALQQGKYAGDIYTSLKRAQLEQAVSDSTCGIDCSGFLSRCWRLPRPYSTRELPALCTPLDSYDDLQPGDLLNKHNVHALLFVKFLNDEKSRFLAYETGSPPTWKVLLNSMGTKKVRDEGYLPYRYRGMDSPPRGSHD